jgi:hypothetical protein
VYEYGFDYVVFAGRGNSANAVLVLISRVQEYAISFKYHQSVFKLQITLPQSYVWMNRWMFS